MGNQSFSCHLLPSRSRSTKIKNLQNLYHEQVFNENLLTAAQFRQKIKSIQKRSAYLRYQWALKLMHFIRTSNRDVLYAEYKKILMENCLKTRQKEKEFYSVKIRKTFLENLRQQVGRSLQNITFELLESLIEQCKAFLMVTSWLYEMISLKEDRIDQKENQINKRPYCCQIKEMYEILLILAEKYYQQLFKQQQCLPIVNIADNKIRQLITCIKNKRTFKEREFIIMEIIRCLEADSKRNESDFIGICQVIGKSRVAAHLFLIKQVGTYECSQLEKYWDRCQQKPIFRKIDSKDDNKQ